MTIVKNGTKDRARALAHDIFFNRERLRVYTLCGKTQVEMAADTIMSAVDEAVTQAKIDAREDGRAAGKIEGVLEEREACALIADDMAAYYGGQLPDNVAEGCEEIARRIRGRV